MSILLDALKKKSLDDTPTQSELLGHHIYQSEILADGFVSPIVLPRHRLMQLKENMSLEEFADKCRVPTREIKILLENEEVEPNHRQLYSISFAFGVSPFWLLGYHTSDSGPSIGDRQIMSAMAKRNSIEVGIKRLGKEKGIFGDLMKTIQGRRLTKANMAFSMTAARIIATEHIPLNEAELQILQGQPVFIEYPDSLMEWGLVLSDFTSQTLSRKLYFEDAGVAFNAYQTPNCAQVLPTE